jgi:hypothetical protein
VYFLKGFDDPSTNRCRYIANWVEGKKRFTGLHVANDVLS